MTRGPANTPSPSTAVAIAVVLLASGPLACTDSRPNRRQTSTADSSRVAVPSVIGVAEASALAALAAQRLEGRVVEEVETCSKPAGTVLRQEPPGMTQADAGGIVRLVLARRGPAVAAEPGEGGVVLSPGAVHEFSTAAPRVAFALAGQACGAGTVTLSGPGVAPTTYPLRAGERATHTLPPGASGTTVRFASLDAGARLVVTTDTEGAD